MSFMTINFILCYSSFYLFSIYFTEETFYKLFFYSVQYSVQLYIVVELINCSIRKYRYR